MALVAGVDGCKGGWFVVLWDGHSTWREEFCPTFECVVKVQPSPHITAVDIPIGLLENGCRGGRVCERVARSLLGWPRRNSVFSAPGRKALSASSYREARILNEPAGLTKQSYALFPKLRQVDQVMTPNLQKRIKETHPELCFYAANDGSALRNSKRSRFGQVERIKILQRRLGKAWGVWYAEMLQRYQRNQVGVDDILDASIAAWTAHRILQGEAARIPPSPPTDKKGLAMEMWY